MTPEEMHDAIGAVLRDALNIAAARIGRNRDWRRFLHNHHLAVRCPICLSRWLALTPALAWEFSAPGFCLYGGRAAMSATKISISLTGEALAAVKESARNQGATVSEAIRRALAINRFIDRVRSDGSELLVRRSNGDIERIVFAWGDTPGVMKGERDA